MVDAFSQEKNKKTKTLKKTVHTKRNIYIYAIRFKEQTLSTFQHTTTWIHIVLLGLCGKRDIDEEVSFVHSFIHSFVVVVVLGGGGGGGGGLTLCW